MTDMGILTITCILLGIGVVGNLAAIVVCQRRLDALEARKEHR